MFKIIKEKKLNEAFSDSFPDWLKEALSRRDLMTKGRYDKTEKQKFNIAWDTAIYHSAPIPNSARTQEMKDENRLKVFRLRIPKNYAFDGDDPYREFVYIPNLLDPNLSSCSKALGVGDYLVYAGNVSYKKLKPYVIEFGYILLDESGSLDKVDARKNAREGSIERDRKRGLHSLRKYIGDGKYSDELTWVTDKGYDKSGYKLDPYKYTRMLAEMGTKDTKIAARKIEELYQRIEDTKARAAQILMDNTSKDLGDKPEDEWSTKMELVSNAIRNIASAVDSYKRLLKTLDEIEKEEHPDFSSWYSRELLRNSEEVKDYLKYSDEYLAKIK